MLDNNKEDLSSTEMNGKTEAKPVKKEEVKVEKIEVENEIKTIDVLEEKAESISIEKIEEDKKEKEDVLEEDKSEIKGEEATTEEVDKVD